MTDKKHETVQQILFWPAVDDYLRMKPSVRAKLEDIIKFSTDILQEKQAELINVSHAFVQIPPDLTSKAITAVLIKVVEYAAATRAQGRMLHVGCVSLSREKKLVDTSQGKVMMKRENIFVPVKVV